ncbi:DUF58 domain-containing protein [Sporolactobacillus inulinus]|uniref:Uncharacterized protein n=1 Tax=Sporolactobacillus inulinus CASD TaxID=1069536 RepID=A0A0U1QNA7_9BACL|nr:DUF58 domain-containing protein [Sporolactobacillus inulinus]KLI02290.1 hypothetical protein SINU_08780 [Sporolactobacillus inulinus CASD]GEB75833.1 hypothetical protein SIN01_01780 [Sporolactobacillus inulinus]
MTVKRLLRRLLRSFMRTLPALTVTVVLFLFALAQGGFLAWFLFYVFIPVDMYLLLLFVYPFRTMTVERTKVNQRIFAGDTLNLTVRLKRRWAVPFFLLTLIERPDDQRLAHATMKTQMLIWLTSELTTTIRLPNMPRGTFSLNQLELTVGDPFGFFKRTVFLSDATTVFVYPKPVQLSVDDLNLTRHGAYASSEEADRANFAGVRDYRPNDRPSWLDWKSAARTRTLVTKLFEPEQERLASVILVATKTEENERFELAISYTASLLKTLLNCGFTVSLSYRSGTQPLLLHDHSERTLVTAYQALAELTKEQVLELDEVQITTCAKNIGYAVSTDEGLAAVMSRFADTYRRPQKLFYIVGKQTPQVHPQQPSSWFSMLYVTKKQAIPKGKTGDDYGRQP